MSWLLTPFIAANVAKLLSDDRQTLGVFKIYVTGAIDLPVFDTLSRTQHPVHAAGEGQLDIVKWLFPLMTEYDDVSTLKNMFSKAIKNKQDEVVEWLIENGCQIYVEDGCSLIENGYIDELKFMVTRGNKFDKTLCKVASRKGDLDLLIWLHENGCTWSSDVCTEAARCGHLHCLMYAHENGCPWDNNTITFAHITGHFDCFDYAYENGCPSNIFRFRDGSYGDEMLDDLYEDESSDDDWSDDE
jgi:hypothetical protein